MNMPPPLLVFTDLDGTLLSHTSYRWDAATQALDTLRDIGAALVIASSKSAPEIIEIRAQLGWTNCPAIIENGAGILPPESTDTPNTDTYVRLRRLRTLRACRTAVRLTRQSARFPNPASGPAAPNCAPHLSTPCTTTASMPAKAAGFSHCHTGAPRPIRWPR